MIFFQGLFRNVWKWLVLSKCTHNYTFLDGPKVIFCSLRCEVVVRWWILACDIIRVMCSCTPLIPMSTWEQWPSKSVEHSVSAQRALGGILQMILNKSLLLVLGGCSADRPLLIERSWGWVVQEINMRPKYIINHSINTSFIVGPWGLVTNHNNVYVYLVLNWKKKQYKIFTAVYVPYYYRPQSRGDNTFGSVHPSIKGSISISEVWWVYLALDRLKLILCFVSPKIPVCMRECEK